MKRLLMEHYLHIIPSNCQQSPLDLLSGLEQARQPLCSTAGNTQPRALVFKEGYPHNKGYLARSDRPTYLMPTAQSQLSLKLPENTLDRQRQSLRRRRHSRYTRNPIACSPQYLAYRARQSRDGNQEDAKWPEVLEIAFLDGNTLSRPFVFTFTSLTRSKPLWTSLQWVEENSLTKANHMAVMS